MTRRRKNTKPKTDNIIREPQENKAEIKYTPVQLEQTELAKQLESYIKEFETKVKQLNCKLLDRELIVLFVANLHPRWKRLVEPVEYSFKKWEDAADVASYHCIRLSALLRSERNDTSQLFTTQESIEVLHSGYFASETNPDVERHLRENSIQHLISPTFKKTALSPTISPTSAVSIEKKEKIKEKPREKERGKEKELEKAKEKTQEKEVTPAKKIEDKEIEKTDKPRQEVKKEPQKSEIKNKENIVEFVGNSICYKVPECYEGVNLMFLNLNVNGKDVKGLLSKLSWGCSAISLDCVKYLGLPMVTSSNYCINTDFGVVDALGHVNLPIMHLSDPSVKSELTTQVLPLIYNGKVDMIFGSDFFFKFKPILNIRQRAIKFLDKEVPYIVQRLC